MAWTGAVLPPARSQSQHIRARRAEQGANSGSVGCPKGGKTKRQVIPGSPVHEQQETELKQRSEDRMETEAGLETELW